MRMIMSGILCVLVIDVFAGIPDVAELAIRNSALGKYTYRVVDDEGRAVSNA